MCPKECFLTGTGISGRSSYLQSPPRKVPRWKGRTPYPFPTPSAHSPAPSAQQPSQTAAASADGYFCTSSAGQAPEAPGNCPSSQGLLPQRYRLMHQLMQDLEAGEVQRVRQRLQGEVGSDILHRHPELCFELYR